MNLVLDPAALKDAEAIRPDGILREVDGARATFRRDGAVVGEMRSHVTPAGDVRIVGVTADGTLVEVSGPRDWPGLPAALRLMRDASALPSWRLALFEQCGDLSVEAMPPVAGSDEIVCECKGVTRGQIEALVPTCRDRAGIGAACGAGTVCGGCASLIDEIAETGSSGPAELVEIERIDAGHARFRFLRLSGAAPAPAGSHVYVQAMVDGRWIGRPYTVAGSHGDGSWDIVVKREPGGIFSRWLHDHAATTSTFKLSLPQTVHAGAVGERVAYLVAGVGVTPALAALADDGRGDVAVHWSLKGGDALGLGLMGRAMARDARCPMTVRDTVRDGRVADWGALCPPGSADTVVVCGPAGYVADVLAGLTGAGWERERIRVDSFGSRRPSPTVLRHVDSFDYLQEPVVASSFHLKPVESVEAEAFAFLRQFYFEHGAPAAFEARWAEVLARIEETGTYVQTYDELAFGARLAWRNSARCIGRFFWKTLQVRDLRHVRTEEGMFAAVVSHMEAATGAGDIQPIITVFSPDAPNLRILNPQVVLYAGHRNADGTVTGDPKNVALTDLAKSLGWKGRGTRFDVLPLVIQVGDAAPRVFELPEGLVLEVPLSHPRVEAFASLDLKWFSVPAVSGMALDLGGIQYGAAPSNGFYMGTEIGSVNLADPSRYDECARVAAAMGIDTGEGNPLWRDQAMLDLNVAVLHSFAKAGVRILDHHSLSDYFMRFREAEAREGRPSYGHWAWVMPPMGGNLSPIWRDNTLRKKILKPAFLYQTSEPVPSSD